MNKPLLIGLGNQFRGDDAIGPIVADHLKLRFADEMEMFICNGNTIEIIDLWNGRDSVFVIDALYSGQKPYGFVHRLFPLIEEIPSLSCSSSTHVVDIIQAIELAKALSSVPKHLVFYGIEAYHFAQERTMSKHLCEALNVILNTIENDIRRHLCTK